jgi:hypothetical protein
MAVGAGGACTVGENGFGWPGSMRGAFSVGSTGAPGAGAPGAGLAGAVVAAVVAGVVSVVVSGASSSCAQAVNTPMETIVAIPAVAANRRAIRLDLMLCPICGVTELYRPKNVSVNADVGVHLAIRLTFRTI